MYRHKTLRILLCVSILTSIMILLINLLVVYAQEKKDTRLIFIEENNSENYDYLVSTFVKNAKGNLVRILILPIGLAKDFDNLSENEYSSLNVIAELYRSNIEDICLNLISSDQKCEIVLVTIFTRSEALDRNKLDLISDPISGIILLGDNVENAANIISSREIQQELINTYQRGAVVAGGKELSFAILAGYTEGFSNDPFQFGAIDILNTEKMHGMDIGIDNIIFENQIFTNGNLQRLLNSITLPNSPHIGIGVETNSAIQITNDRIVEYVVGENYTVILDAETYHAADSTQYKGSDNHISVRNVLFHTLSESDISYNLDQRIISTTPPEPILERTFNDLSLPLGAGKLIISSGIDLSQNYNSILSEFVNISGGQFAKITIIAIGYSSEAKAQSEISKIQGLINVDAESIILSNESGKEIQISGESTGIIVVGDTESTINPQSLNSIKEAWLAGAPLLIDGAVSNMAGLYYSTVTNILDSDLHSGLGIIDALIHPLLILENNWGTFLSSAYLHPERLSLGMSENTAILFDKFESSVLGDGVVLILDLRSATFLKGGTQQPVIANGLIDVFTQGEILRPSKADISIAPIHVPTPDIEIQEIITQSSLSPPIKTQTPHIVIVTATKSKKLKTEDPTKEPRPTATPLLIPPPGNPNQTNLMIGIAFFVVFTILFALWLNRKRYVK